MTTRCLVIEGMMSTKHDPTTGSLPTQRKSLTPEAVRALQEFAEHCTMRAERARSSESKHDWLHTADRARTYIRENT